MLLGNGDGTFGAETAYAVGTNPYSIAFGDFNGDGRVDLATGTGPTVSVLLGVGDGTFGAATQYDASGVVKVADVNGDGKLDLVTSSVSVLLGNGDGTFAAASNFAAGSQPSSVAIGDLDGIGLPDLVVVNYSGQPPYGAGSIAVLLNTPDNHPPTITSNGGGDSASRLVAENTTAVTTVVAADPDAGQTLTYTIADGADAALFTINPTTGALAFANAPDFEAKADADANNVYDVTVQVWDGNGGIDTQAIAVTVTNVVGVSLTSDAATIPGTNEEDVLTGLDGNNTLQGFRGNDILKGGAGNDNFLYTVGDGADTIDGGKGADTLTIIGEPGADTINVIVSGSSIIGLEGGTVTNVEKATLDLGNGTDTLSYTGTSSPVSVNLSSPATATGFNSILGVENVTGGSGNDTLTGNSGANVLNGGAGADTLSGGGGSDKFVFTTLANSRAAAFDTITDFTPGVDQLQIGHELASLTTGTVKGTGNLATDLASVLNANNLMAYGAAEVTIKGGKDAGTYVVINDNTAGYNASNDGVVMLAGAPVLHTTDFIV